MLVNALILFTGFMLFVAAVQSVCILIKMGPNPSGRVPREFKFSFFVGGLTLGLTFAFKDQFPIELVAVIVLGLVSFASFYPVRLCLQQNEAGRRRLEQTFENKIRETTQIHEQRLSSLQVEGELRTNALLHDISNPLQVLFYHLTIILKSPERFLTQFSPRSEKVGDAMAKTLQVLNEAKHAATLDYAKNSKKIAA